MGTAEKAGRARQVVALAVAVTLLLAGFRAELLLAEVKNDGYATGSGEHSRVTGARAGALAEEASKAFGRFLEGRQKGAGAAQNGTRTAQSGPHGEAAAANESAPRADAIAARKAGGFLDWLNGAYRSYQEEVVGRLAISRQSDLGAGGNGVAGNESLTPGSIPRGGVPVAGVAEAPRPSMDEVISASTRFEEARRHEMTRKAEAERRASQRRGDEAAKQAEAQPKHDVAKKRPGDIGSGREKDPVALAPPLAEGAADPPRQHAEPAEKIRVDNAAPDARRVSATSVRKKRREFRHSSAFMAPRPIARPRLQSARYVRR